MIKERLAASSLCDDSYGWRYFLWVPPALQDFKKFPLREISNRPPAFHFKKDENLGKKFIDRFKTVKYKTRRGEKKLALEKFLASTNTSAFIVIKDDTILYEGYFNGFTRESLNNSFSISKSVISMLVGIAIADGYIRSVDDPVVDYLPELKEKGVGQITLKHLLTMSSGLKHTLGYAPWHDNARAYFSPDLRKFALEVKVEEEPDQHYNYNNCHAQLLGMILEKVTRQPVSGYLQEKLWKPLGMEYPASWNLDNKKNGFELMIAGLNAAPIDFAKLGRLYLHKGNWEGKQLVPAQWVVESTKPTGPYDNDYYSKKLNASLMAPELSFFTSGKGYYGYFWFGYPNEDGGYDFFSYGVLGQYVYVAPAKNVIITRFGKNPGDVFWWPDVLRDMAGKIPPGPDSF